MALTSLSEVGSLRSAALEGFDRRTYAPHPLHGLDRVWSEANCYVDLWIELLHGLGLEPLACCAFTVSTGFDGDQWTFFKPPPEDLRRLFGIGVLEINVWRPLIDHLLEQMNAGRLLTIEVDSFYLPDTRGVSYGLEHTKTTLVPVAVDVDRRWMAYFHGSGCFELAGDDFDWLLRRREQPATMLAPYVEVIRLEGLRRLSAADLRAESVDLLRGHLMRRPVDHPVRELAKQVTESLPWLATAGASVFHAYSFGVCRQCGSSAEIAASYLDWLGDTSGAAAHWRLVAGGAKSLQFALARASRGRAVDPDAILSGMVDAYDRALAALCDHYGC